MEKTQEVQNIYQYYDADVIKTELKFPVEQLEKAAKLRESKSIVFEKIQTGYIEGCTSMAAEIIGNAKIKNTPFNVSILFTKYSVLRTSCGCPSCLRYSYMTNMKRNCEYIAALYLILKDYLSVTEVGDATDKTGAFLLNSFEERHAKAVVSEKSVQEEKLTLEPRLIKKYGDLSLTFKVGAKKKFIIKNLTEFCENVHQSMSVQYGTTTIINHNLANFDEESKSWYYFIEQAVREEQEMERRMSENYRYYYSYQRRKISALELYGWRADSFFELIKDKGIAFEDRDIQKKSMLKVYIKNPNIVLQICQTDRKRKKSFQGIDVSCTLPDFFYGAKEAYYIEEDVLCKVEESFMHSIEPLVEYSNSGSLQFKIGRNKLTDFYYSVLPQLEEVVTVAETDSEEIHKYLPPEVSFAFYLDAQAQNVTCRVEACYGENKRSALDFINPEMVSMPFEGFRIGAKEREADFLVRQLLPYVDFENDIFHCNSEEELVYEVLSHGIDDLAQIGEVRCTQSFKNLNIVKKLRMSVGVSVTNDLLNLEITTEDVSREELLEILKSYKTNKKYYRLRNGDFLNVEDENLQMLKELVETMHLPPKEFIKGKVHLPMYRTLYLDKLLEEKDGIYATRDITFRKMVKNFKTVSDADFEEPKSLLHIMRNYQRNGFKWMKLLGSCQFGGILADDMGLGKTLQAIAVLLSAKEEGKEGTSLVVAPSSLVFNWGEEFARFAPSMEVELITGTQKERQDKLAQYQKKDVLVTSYDLLKRDISYYEDMEFFYEIIDEAQYIKNHTTAASKAVKVIKSCNRLALTGTPIENRLSELWSIFDFLMPGFLYGYEDFKKNIETPVVKNENMDAMARLQRMVSPFIMRRLKNQVLKDLPDKLEEIRYVKLDDKQQKIYDAQVVHMQEMLSKQNPEDFNKNKLQMLAELTRLRQICCDPSLCFANYGGESAKLESCIELIQSAMDGGHKMLIFSQFTSMIDILEKCLQDLGIAFFTITGSTAKEKRLQMVKTFNEDDTPVFLISLKAGGVGLNLTGADVVIHYDPWWNLAVQNQATDRAHRIGQTKKVTVYKLIVRHSIEEKIQKLQEVKKDLAEQVMNGETGQLGSMSKEELLELLNG